MLLCSGTAGVFGAFHRIGGDQRMLVLAGLDGDGHALAPGQHQRLLPAKGDEALLFAAGQVEALGYRRRARRILCFEHFDGRVGGHDAAPGILHELFGVLRHGHQTQVALARPPRERRQEVPTGGMLDQRGRLVDVERARPPAVVERLRPDTVGDERDGQGAQFAAHIADVPHHETARQIDRGEVREQAGQAAGDVAVQPPGEIGLVGPAEAALQEFVELVQERRLAVMRARVAADAHLAIGFVERPVQETFLAFGQHATAG